MPPPMPFVETFTRPLLDDKGLELERLRPFMAIPGPSIPPIGIPTAPELGDMLRSPDCRDGSRGIAGLPSNSGLRRSARD